MIKPSADSPPFHRTADLAVALAAILFVAPLLVVSAALILVSRRGDDAEPGRVRTAIAGFLYRSGLGDLPQLFDLVRGRASLFAGPPAETTAISRLPEPIRLPQTVPVPNMIRQLHRAPSNVPRRHLRGDLDMLGRNLRAGFSAPASNDFDDLLSALDRSRPGPAGLQAEAL